MKTYYVSFEERHTIAVEAGSPEEAIDKVMGDEYEDANDSAELTFGPEAVEAGTPEEPAPIETTAEETKTEDKEEPSL